VKVLVTGVAGYIGSITADLLIKDGLNVVGIDNLSTGYISNINKDIEFIEIDMLNINSVLDKISECEAVIHFAARSLVEESLRLPSFYYKNNVDGSSALLDVLKHTNIRKIVFSSSASVYGNPIKSSINEFHQTNPLSTYGETKLKTEIDITQHCMNDNYGAVTLRYFNVSGAVLSDGIWLSEKHVPETHLIPNILNSNMLSPVKIFGSDWNTKDGSCIRDFVHVGDIAKAHIKALEIIAIGKNEIINLGSGSGYSVYDVIRESELVTGKRVFKEILERRAGDPDILVADISKAKHVLDWQPSFTLKEIISDSWMALNAK
jgi:UDP-glucose 4-epimerase